MFYKYSDGMKIDVEMKKKADGRGFGMQELGR